MGGFDNVYLMWLAGQITPKERVPLGVRLGFNNADLGRYEADYQGNVKLQIYHMLVDWRNGMEGGDSAKVEQLGKVLVQVGRTDLNKILLSDFGHGI